VSLVRVDWQLKRTWVLGRREHHGEVGVLIIAAGLALVAHDWHDRHHWFRRHP
jgi:hypothetical protein